MGVQDFDLKVQEAVNRIQPEAMTVEVYHWARELGVPEHQPRSDLRAAVPDGGVIRGDRPARDRVRSRPDRRLQLRPRPLAQAAPEADPPGGSPDAGTEARNPEDDHRELCSQRIRVHRDGSFCASRTTNSRGRRRRRRSTGISRGTPRGPAPICTASACRRSATSRTIYAQNDKELSRVLQGARCGTARHTRRLPDDGRRPASASMSSCG